MAYFKSTYKKLSKKWHPQAVSLGKPIEMDELCKQIALISTGKGVDAAEKVNANQIIGTRVRFVPESRRQGGTVTRGLIGEDVTWTNVNSISQLDGTGTPGGNTPPDSGGGGDQNENPLE